MTIESSNNIFPFQTTYNLLWLIQTNGWNECILRFPKKGDFGLAKNYWGITHKSLAAKIYNALLHNRIEPKIDNILRKDQNGFRRNRSTISQILTIRRILERVRAKNLPATILFVDFILNPYKK